MGQTEARTVNTSKSKKSGTKSKIIANLNTKNTKIPDNLKIPKEAWNMLTNEQKKAYRKEMDSLSTKENKKRQSNKASTEKNVESIEEPQPKPKTESGRTQDIFRDIDKGPDSFKKRML